MLNYPNTYQSLVGNNQQTDRDAVFDPALRHFPRAYRLGDPTFPDEDTTQAWYDTRLQVADHLLRLLADSPWNEHLVLRGSLLLKEWLGDAARQPSDIDWVFRPSDVGIRHPLSVRLFEDMIAMVSARHHLGNVVIRTDKISVDDIWTYERASGRRIVFPWKADDLPPGYVQMDVVFCEELLTEPVQTPIFSPDGESVTVWAADKEMSLAWKLLWLETDMLPQGKDLYDATLLAEQTTLSLDLLYRVLKTAEWTRGTLDPDFPMKWHVNWVAFQVEYPWVRGDAHYWQKRLTSALSHMFT